jgi:hypothetical protein
MIHLMCYCIKRNIIINQYALIVKCAKFGKLKNMIWLLNNNYINRYNSIIDTLHLLMQQNMAIKIF